MTSADLFLVFAGTLTFITFVIAVGPTVSDAVRRWLHPVPHTEIIQLSDRARRGERIASEDVSQLMERLTVADYTSLPAERQGDIQRILNAASRRTMSGGDPEEPTTSGREGGPMALAQPGLIGERTEVALARTGLATALADPPESVSSTEIRADPEETEQEIGSETWLGDPQAPAATQEWPTRTAIQETRIAAPTRSIPLDEALAPTSRTAAVLSPSQTDITQLEHWEVRKQLSDYLDSALSEDDRRRVQSHLESCRACVGHMDTLRATVKALGRLPAPKAPTSALARILEQARKESYEEIRRQQ